MKIDSKIAKQWYEEFNSLKKIPTNSERPGWYLSIDFFLVENGISNEIYFRNFNILEINHVKYCFDPFTDFFDLCLEADSSTDFYTRVTSKGPNPNYEYFFNKLNGECSWYNETDSFSFVVLNGSLNINDILSTFSDSLSVNCSLKELYDSSNESILVVNTDKYIYRIKKIKQCENCYLFDVHDENGYISCIPLYEKYNHE